MQRPPLRLTSPTVGASQLGFFTGQPLQVPLILTKYSQRPGKRHARARGFTLIELVAVLVLAGILAAFAGARFFQREAYDARSFTDQAMGIMRYGQKLAVAQNRPVFVRLDGASVALCFDAACTAANRVLPLSGSNSGNKETLAACNQQSNWLCEGKPAVVSMATVPANTTGFYFDALGKPYALGDVFPAASTFPARLAVTIQGDGSTRSIQIEGETGYVYL